MSKMVTLLIRLMSQLKMQDDLVGTQTHNSNENEGKHLRFFSREKKKRRLCNMSTLFYRNWEV